MVRSFSPGSAAGPSGLRSQHLLYCLNSADSAAREGLLEALLTLVTATSTERAHLLAALYLCAARLILLSTKDGGLRPIAVGDTLRRLVANWLLPSAQGRNAAAAFAPLQTAFANGSSCEVVAIGPAGGRPAREHGLAPAAGGPEYRLQLHRTTGRPGGHGANTPIHAAVDAAGLRARAPAGRARGLEINMRKSTVWGPGLVPATSPLAAAARLHLEEGTEVLGVSPPGQVGCEICAYLLGGRGLVDLQSAHALMRNCLGPAKEPATTPPHGGLRGRGHGDPAGARWWARPSRLRCDRRPPANERGLLWGGQ